MLAMALICHPALLIADEPTTALDVTIQAQVLNLMRTLQRELDMSILLITHDLGVVANMADEVVVIYHGEIMEAGTAEDIFRRPQHPYLKALLHALPHFNMKPGERLTALRDTSGDLAPLDRHAGAMTERGRGAKPGVPLAGRQRTCARPTRASGPACWASAANGSSRSMTSASTSGAASASGSSAKAAAARPASAS